MKIILNASTCVVGGGVQVSVGLIRFLYTHALDMEVHAFASPKVFAQCRDLQGRGDFRIEEVVISPASILRGRKSRQRIRTCIVETKAQLLFTVFGPSYLWVSIPELSGFAEPFVMVPHAHCYDNHNWREWLLSRAYGFVKRQALRRVEEFWVETKVGARGLAQRLGIDESRVHVVPNAVNALFEPILDTPSGWTGQRHRILLLAADYPHKNHRILAKISEVLQREYPEFDFEFVCTIPREGRVWKALAAESGELGVADRICNLGPVTIKECPRLYADASVVIHPSLQEVFSATYLEAMAAERPLVVSDFPFSREVCGDAAAYFDVTQPKAAARAIVALCTDMDLREKQIKAGLARLKQFPTGDEKNAQLVALIRDFVRRHPPHNR